MKHTLTAIAAASLLALTACADTTAADNETFTLSGEDYSHLLIMSRWVPNDIQEDPIEGTASVRVVDSTTDEDIEYYTPAPFGLEIPTVDTDDWYTEYILVDDGHSLTAGFETKVDPSTGELQCGIVSLENGEFLDFQQSAGETSVSCYALVGE
jgi:hypothetical protein